MQNGNGANSFMTAVEAAEQLGVSDTAVRKWIANGTIQANKHSREWRIPLSEVERLRQESNGAQPHRTTPSDKPNEQAERTHRTTVRRICGHLRLRINTFVEREKRLYNERYPPKIVYNPPSTRFPNSLNRSTI